MAPEVLSSHFKKDSGLEESDIIKIWVIASFVMICVLVTISAFTLSFEEIFPPLLFLVPQLYYIPIILITIWYPKYGLQATIMIVAAFLAVTSYFYFTGSTTIGPYVTGLNAAMFLWVVVATSQLTDEGGLLKYLNIFKNSDAGIVLYDQDSGKIKEANARFAGMLGFEQKELTGLPVTELWYDTLTGQKLLEELKNNGSVANRTERMLAKSGEIRWVDLSCKKSHSYRHVECTAIDVTERVEKEAALVSQNERLEDFINSSQDLLFMQDGQGQFIQFHWANSNNFGIDAGEMIGKTPFEIFSHTVAERLEQYREEVLQSGETLNFDFPEYLGGEERHFSIILGPVNDDSGATVGVIGTMHDITGQSMEDITYMQMERELDRWRNFINTAAHELRTPLQPILGYLHLILEDPASFALDSQTVHLLQLCLENVERERRVVDRMLELGIMDSARVHMNVSDIPLRQFIATINRIGGYDLKAEMEIDVSPDTTILADRDHIFQVLDGLIANAVQYSDPPRIVNIRYAEQDGNHIISVSDNGHGIPEESLNAIFEPFFLADHENLSRQYGRIGLGLSIAKRYVEMHGGSIQVESAVDVGSTFTVLLPKEVHCEPE